MYIYLFILLFLAFPGTAAAYIGPGAGFAFFSSFLFLFGSIALAVGLILTWPIRYLYLRVRRGFLKSSKDKRIIILGLDGLDPKLVKRFMREGRLKNFQKLQEKGSFSPLGTTASPISPVAWSSFTTGANPGKHNIFDFLTPKKYMPTLSSTSIQSSEKKLSIGKYRIPLGKSSIKPLRKGVAFWKILGKQGHESSILRVPITFPPEKFHGRVLSAMCTPDLRGSQGTFTFYTTDHEKYSSMEGGKAVHICISNGKIKTSLAGPKNTFLQDSPDVEVAISIKITGEEGASLTVGGKKITLKLKDYSEWVVLDFPMLPGIKTSGICRFLLTSVKPHFNMYVTPIQINPQKPALPISHPFIYSTYLALSIGTFATLGLAEDTWALNERVIDEGDFLKQAYMIHEERERMFMQEVKKLKSGVCACVFDITDRVQHMFFRYETPGHPANKGKDVEKYKNTIPELYKNMDDMLGRLMENIRDDDLLMVVSDHGFKPFVRCVNLNSWLLENNYLYLKEGKEGEEWFGNVDWSRTKAYSLGLCGIFLNKKGREQTGIVTEDESEKLAREIQGKLSGLRDEEKKETAIRNVYLAKDIYNGPYTENAPELVIGFNIGYRASWESVKGVADNIIIDDNTKSWSGDHCMDPPLVPGVFFANRKLKTKFPHIMDIGPTVLKEFGLSVPSYMDGKALDLEVIE